jgi:hypothetical protein
MVSGSKAHFGTNIIEGIELEVYLYRFSVDQQVNILLMYAAQNWRAGTICPHVSCAEERCSLERQSKSELLRSNPKERWRGEHVVM